MGQCSGMSLSAANRRRFGCGSRGNHRCVSLSLAVLTPGSAESLDQALDVYYERADGQADEATLEAFADELDASYNDESWPFAGDAIVMPACVELTIALRRGYR
jgi:hypothetical protein